MDHGENFHFGIADVVDEPIAVNNSLPNVLIISLGYTTADSRKLSKISGFGQDTGRHDGTVDRRVLRDVLDDPFEVRKGGLKPSYLMSHFWSRDSALSCGMVGADCANSSRRRIVSATYSWY